MLAQLSRRLSINGGRASFFKTLLQYPTSTATSAEPPQKNYFLEEYLINSIGFSKEEATSALMKHKKLGISDENVAKFMLRNPRAALSLNPGRIEKICQRVENELGINRESAMFFNGFVVMSSVSKSKFDLKWEIFRSFDWSDTNIHKLLGNLPSILTLSEARMKEALDFLMRELGYGPDYLASRPRLFTLSLEKRVKLRNEVLKILNAKKLNKRKASLYSVLCLSELKFVEGYLFPYKDEIPDIYESYTRIH